MGQIVTYLSSSQGNKARTYSEIHRATGIHQDTVKSIIQDIITIQEDIPPIKQLETKSSKLVYLKERFPLPTYSNIAELFAKIEPELREIKSEMQKLNAQLGKKR